MLFWIHLLGGVSLGLVLLFFSVTGALLAFQPQLTRWSERGIRAGATDSCGALSSVIAETAAESKLKAASVTVFATAISPMLYTVDNETVYLADPCTGTLLRQQPSATRRFFSQVKDLHRWAAFQGVKHEKLRSLKDAANLLFLLLLVTGLTLWIPRKVSWASWRAVLLIRPKLRGRAREWNLHNVAGIWFALPLLLISLTGAVMSYGWANGWLFRLAGTPVPTAAEERAGNRSPQDLGPLDSLIGAAKAQDPNWQAITIRIPKVSDKVVNFVVDDSLDNQPQGRSQLAISRQGRVVRWEPLQALPRGRRWRIYVRFLHSGELFGLPGQGLMFLAAIALFALLWTGYSLAFRRLLSWKTRRARKASAMALTA